MLQKRLLPNGQKARQRSDREDRSLQYRDWIRTVDCNGYFVDIDFIKIKRVGDKWVPCAITELTRCDSTFITDSYLKAVIDRYFRRDSQGRIMQGMGELFHIPVYLVLFQKEMLWVWVYSFRKKVWREFTPESWAEFLEKL